MSLSPECHSGAIRPGSVKALWAVSPGQVHLTLRSADTTVRTGTTIVIAALLVAIVAALVAQLALAT